MELKQVNKEEIIEEIAEIEQKAKTFFSSERWRNWLTFLFFVALAFGFWVMEYFRQHGNQLPITSYQLPITNYLLPIS